MSLGGAAKSVIFGVLAEFLAGKNLFHDSGQRVIYVPCQQAAGGTRIGDQFLFVQALSGILYLYGCQVVVAVRVLLKFGQVVGSGARMSSLSRLTAAIRAFRTALQSPYSSDAYRYS